MSAAASAEGGAGTLAASAQRSRSVAASAAVVESRAAGTGGVATADALAETADDELAAVTVLSGDAAPSGDQPSGACTITMLEHFGHERMCPIKQASRTASREPHVSQRMEKSLSDTMVKQAVNQGSKAWQRLSMGAHRAPY